MTENSICEVCQADGEGGSEEDLCSSGFAERVSSVERRLPNVTTERTSLAVRTDVLRAVSV